MAPWTQRQWNFRVLDDSSDDEGTSSGGLAEVGKAVSSFFQNNLGVNADFDHQEIEVSKDPEISDPNAEVNKDISYTSELEINGDKRLLEEDIAKGSSSALVKGYADFLGVEPSLVRIHLRESYTGETGTGGGNLMQALVRAGPFVTQRTSVMKNIEKQ